MLKGFNELDLYSYTLIVFRMSRCKSTYYYETGSLYNKYFQVYLQSIIFWILLSRIITQWSHNVSVVFLHDNMDTYYRYFEIHRCKVYWLPLIFLNLCQFKPHQNVFLDFILFQRNAMNIINCLIQSPVWSKNIKNPFRRPMVQVL